MPSRSNRETLPSYDRNGNTTGPRPTVGEADPETRRRLLREQLNKPSRAEGVAPRQPPRIQRTEPATASEGVSPNAMRLLRDRGKQIDKEVSKRDK